MNFHPGTLLATCVAAGLLGLSVPIHAQTIPTVAKAMAVDGTVYVTRSDGRQGILARGTELSVGDTFTTTRNSSGRS